MNNKKQKVICKVWAPWCGHCKELNKIWPFVENKIRKTKGDGLLVSIVETMIPSVNCLDSREVPGYPWIFSMKGGGKKKEYNGNRDVDSLVKYIEKKMKKCRTKTKRKRIRKKKKKTRARKSRARKRFLKQLRKLN
jgi:thioredoxin-like negative regulator of GroEL